MGIFLYIHMVLGEVGVIWLEKQTSEIKQKYPKGMKWDQVWCATEGLHPDCLKGFYVDMHVCPTWIVVAVQDGSVWFPFLYKKAPYMAILFLRLWLKMVLKITASFSC